MNNGLSLFVIKTASTAGRSLPILVLWLSSPSQSSPLSKQTEIIIRWKSNVSTGKQSKPCLIVNNLFYLWGKKITIIYHLNKLESPSPKDALCQVWLKLAQLFWRRRFFRECIFTISYLSLLGKGQGPSFEQTWIPSTQGCICAKFSWNWPCGSREEDFKISLMYFRYFVFIFPWKRTGPLI